MRKGYLTVYLSLSLSLILAIILTFIEGARLSVIRMEAECAADIGMNSVLAEFHRELLEQYDLLFVDMSYGTANPRAENTGEHLRVYIQNNLQGRTGNAASVRDWLSLSVDKAVTGELSIASDENGSVMRRQVISYMKDTSLEGMAAKIAGQVQEVQELGLDTRDIDGERMDVQSQIDAIQLPMKEEEGELIEVALDNPADKINVFRGSFALHMVLGNASNISGTAIRAEDYISHREKITGTGLTSDRKIPENIADKLLFDCYLFDKCGWYGNELDKSLMKYQIEYIIAGENSDRGNLEQIVRRLLRWREAANIIYLFSDSAKCAEAEALALTLTAVLQVPALVQPVKYSILFAWAYIESLSDVKALLNGGKIPLMKTASDWKTSIANISSFSGDAAGESAGHGLSYQDYLRVMLYMKGITEKSMRAMDIMEMDIRLTAGNSNFRMDACFDSFMSDISISSAFGYHCRIQKRYGYD